MVASLLIFVKQNLSMDNYVPTNAIQATHAMGLIQTSVTTVSGHKVDFTARVNTALRKCRVMLHSQVENTARDEKNNAIRKILS